MLVLYIFTLEHTIMAKQPEQFLAFPFSGNTSEASDARGKAGKRAVTEYQETMNQYIKETGISPHPGLGKALFTPEDVARLFTQTLEKMSEQVDSHKGRSKNTELDVQRFFQSTIKQVQEQIHEPDNLFFSLLQQSYFLNTQFLKEAAQYSPRLDSSLHRKLSAYIRQLVDTLSVPALFPSESPQYNLPSELPIKPLQLGKSLGRTSGKIVFQNELFQLIQYDALTSQVAKRPLLIVPPWSHKYYIFDLGPENSFVRWAVKSGLTVFVMSWVNPDQRHLDKTITDYALRGIKTALHQVCQLTGEPGVHTVGYGMGGTLLGCLAAYLTKKEDPCIASATFIAAPFDFSKMDERGIYRDDCQQRILAQYGKEKEYLEGRYMVQVAHLLQVNELIWTSQASHYLLGHAPFPFDMLYWACDGLRIPPKLYDTYFRELLLENRLMKKGELTIEDTPIDLQSISTPLFVMAAREDQVVPWQSAYALTQMAKAPNQKFILGASGHITGAFTPPQSPTGYYWMADHLPEKAEGWLEAAHQKTGSWWHEWRQWLAAFEENLVPARKISKEHMIEETPGSYAKAARD